VGTTDPTAGGRGPYRNGIRRRTQIVDVAMQVFGELGFVGGSIRTIADRAGVSPATLLQHFGSKDGLLSAVLEEWGRQTTKGALTEATGLAYFRGFPDLMRFHLANRGLLELFLTIAADASNPDHPARAFIQRRYADGIANLSAQLQQAVADGEVAALTPAEVDQEARLLTAVLDGVELQWLLDPSTDLVALVSTYVDQAIARWQRATKTP
jgi:AcrR family transcriptional regulator